MDEVRTYARLPEFRESIAAYISRTRGIKVDADNVCVVPGGKPIMFFTMMALLEPGDEVIYPNPGFPIYESIINFLGAKPVPVPLIESRGFSFDLNVLKDGLSKKTKMVVLNSPANPTGGVMPKEDVAQIAEMLRDRDVMVLSDEIYSRIFYGVEPSSISSFDGMLEKTDHPRRIFQDLLDDRMASRLRRDAALAGESRQSADGQLQFVHGEFHAARRNSRAGRSTGCCDSDGRGIRRRRDAIVKGFNEIPGWSCTPPAGAFYAFPNITGTGMPAKELANLLLERSGSGVLVGNALSASTAMDISASATPIRSRTFRKRSNGSKRSRVAGRNSSRPRDGQAFLQVCMKSMPS